MKIKKRTYPSSSFKGIEINSIQDKYGFFVNPETKLREFGIIEKIDTHAETQSFAEQCDYSFIMKALSPQANLESFSKQKFEDYEGITSCSPLELALRYEQIKDDFDKFPLEVKNKYGNDSQLFANAVVSGEFFNDFSKFAKKEQPVEVPLTTPATTEFNGNDKRVDELLQRVESLENRTSEVKGE